MKTYRKETFLISICTLFLFVFVFLSIGNATQTDVPETTGSVETTTTLSITGGTTSVFTPTSINFGELEVSSSQQEKNIELEAPNYFGIEDLKGQGGYYTTLQIGELSDGDKTLEVTEAKVRIANLEVHTIAGQEDSNISVPAGVSDFILFDSENPANILERAVTTNGKIGKYGVLPHMKLTIAAYQQVGDYEGTITFTIIEDGSISPIFYASCKELLDNRASSTSGVYTINPSGSEEFEVYCDMETDGGGWTLVWSNLRGGTDKPVTNLVWENAINTTPIFQPTKTLGNDIENIVVYTGLKYWENLGNKIRYDWSHDFNQSISQSFTADYYFDENNKYSIHMSNYSQLVGSVTAGFYDYNNNRKFSTSDVDNDNHENYNCGIAYTGTPFWYGACWNGSINGGGENYENGFYNGAYWYLTDRYFATSGNGLGAGNGRIYVK